MRKFWLMGVCYSTTSNGWTGPNEISYRVRLETKFGQGKPRDEPKAPLTSFHSNLNVVQNQHCSFISFHCSLTQISSPLILPTSPIWDTNWRISLYLELKSAPTDYLDSDKCALGRVSFSELQKGQEMKFGVIYVFYYIYHTCNKTYTHNKT